MYAVHSMQIFCMHIDDMHQNIQDTGHTEQNNIPHSTLHLQ